MLWLYIRLSWIEIYHYCVKSKSVEMRFLARGLSMWTLVIIQIEIMILEISRLKLYWKSTLSVWTISYYMVDVYVREIAFMCHVMSCCLCEAVSIIKYACFIIFTVVSTVCLHLSASLYGRLCSTLGIPIYTKV